MVSSMLKKLCLILLCFFLIGCKQENINTIIQNDEFTTINYPTTGISKLDYSIEKYIVKTFKKYPQHDEYNVSYIYNTYNKKYISISLKTTIIKHYKKINKIKVFNFNKKTNQFMSLKNISTNYNQTQKTVSDISKKVDYSNYIIDNNNIIFYFKDKLQYEIEELHIPLNDLNLIIQNDNNYSDKLFLKERNINQNSKIIAITFDDGPSRYTDNILNILKRQNVRATFFVLGNKVPFYKDTLIKMIKNGNEIGNHSYDHKLLTRLSDDKFLEEINLTQDLIKQYTGFTPKLFRPTYGGYSDRLNSLTNLKLTLWNTESNDWKYNNPNIVINNVVKHSKDGSIILMHDIQSVTNKSIETIIVSLKQQGYTFVTVSELNKVIELRNKM